MFFLMRYVALCGLLGLVSAPAGADTVRGSGRIASESRAVAGYDAVALHGPFTVELRQSGREGVELSGDDNLLPLVETTVVQGRSGKTLDIALKRGVSISSHNDIKVVVHLATLRSVVLSGSGDITGRGLKVGMFEAALSGAGNLRFPELQADRLAVSISGSGDLEASGRAAALEVSVSGSGDVKAAQLACDDVSVHIAGSGDADVQANKTLKVSIFGSGDVSYSGDPKVTSSIAGSGSVHRR